MTDPATIARLEELHRRATQPPWKAEKSSSGGMNVVSAEKRRPPFDWCPAMHTYGAWLSVEDSALIAELRNAMPSLLADARLLAAYKAEAEAWHLWSKNQHDGEAINEVARTRAARLELEKENR